MNWLTGVFRFFLIFAILPLFASHVAGVFNQNKMREENTCKYWFPRLVNEPGVRMEGYAFFNPGMQPATLRFAAYDATGSLVGTPAERAWNAGHQAAYQADGLLGMMDVADGWVEVTANQEELSGMFLSQLYSPELGMDGAAVVLSGTTEGVFSRVAVGAGYETEILLANPAVDVVAVTLTLVGNGPIDELGTWILPSRGMVKLKLGELAPANPGPYEGAVHVSADGRVIGNALVIHASGTLSALNLQSVGGASRRLYAPHAVNMPGNYDTSVQLVNVGSDLTGVIVRVFQADGTFGSPDLNFELDKGEWIRLTENDLGLPENFEGWLLIESNEAPLVSCHLYNVA